MINYDEFYQAKFIGNIEYLGLKTNKTYSIKAKQNRPYGVEVHILGNDGFENFCTYANENSMLRVWDVYMGN